MLYDNYGIDLQKNCNGLTDARQWQLNVMKCIVPQSSVTQVNNVHVHWWWLGVVVSVVGRINEVNQHRGPVSS